MTKRLRKMKSSTTEDGGTRPNDGSVGRASFKKGGIKKGDKPLIGFIGQGFIGKNYADDFERRGFKVVRYAMEEPYRGNKEKIKECDIVFIAVPTPTTPKGFDYGIVQSVLSLVGKGKIAVIKSTLIPRTTEKLQKKYPDIFVFHSPEFLREKTAAHDASHPDRNIVGIPEDTSNCRVKAERVMEVLPRASFERIMRARDAELVKYGSNCFLYVKVIFANLLYDLAQAEGLDWKSVRDAVAADPRIGVSHMEPIHPSGHTPGKSGRGAGGHCFIKDFAAFASFYGELVDDPIGKKLLRTLQDKNNDLLSKSGKDADLLAEVYGQEKKGKPQ